MKSLIIPPSCRPRGGSALRVRSMETYMNAVYSPLEASSPELDQLLARLTASPMERPQVLCQLLGGQACRQIGIYPVPKGFRLSVVIPVYNEERWIRELVRRVQAVPIPKEIVIVEDCCTDRTRAILKELETPEVRVFY